MNVEKDVVRGHENEVGGAWCVVYSREKGSRDRDDGVFVGFWFRALCGSLQSEVNVECDVQVVCVQEELATKTRAPPRRSSSPQWESVPAVRFRMIRYSAFSIDFVLPEVHLVVGPQQGAS